MNKILLINRLTVRFQVQMSIIPISWTLILNCKIFILYSKTAYAEACYAVENTHTKSNTYKHMLHKTNGKKQPEGSRKYKLSDLLTGYLNYIN